MKVLVIGSVNKDIVFDVEQIVKEGQTISSTNQAEYLGGKGLNQTIALSNVYNDVYFYCNVNEHDVALLEQIRQYNFKTDYIQLVKEQTGTAFIQVNKDGENAIVISKNANNHINLQNVKNILDSFTNDDYVLLQNETNNLEEIITLCNDKNIKVILNPSPVNDITLELASKVNILITNKEEFLTITKTSSIEEGLDTFRTNNKKTELVITLGAEGVLHNLEKTTSIQGNKVQVVDTTCAGDTFLGFFIGSRLNGNTIKESLTIANKAASICVQTKGASVSIPKLSDI